MSIGLPIKLVLYDPVTNEPRRCYLCSFISWKLFKATARMAVVMNRKGWNNLLEEERNAIASLVMEVFGRQFTYEELIQGSSLVDMMTVIQEVLNKLRSRDEGEAEIRDHEVEPEAPPDELDDDWMDDWEITLARILNWNPRDIDEMDVVTLKSFMDRFAGSTQVAAGAVPPAKKVMKCDQVDWL